MTNANCFAFDTAEAIRDRSSFGGSIGREKGATRRVRLRKNGKTAALHRKLAENRVKNLKKPLKRPKTVAKNCAMV